MIDVIAVISDNDKDAVVFLFFGGVIALIIKIVATIGLAVVSAVVSKIMTDIIISLVMVEWGYRYALWCMVAYLIDDENGHGDNREENEAAQVMNVILRAKIVLILFLVIFLAIWAVSIIRCVRIWLLCRGFTMMFLDVIRSGSLMGCAAGGIGSIDYEYSMVKVPMVGYFVRYEDNDKGEKIEAIFMQLDGNEFSLDIDGWDVEDDLVYSCAYVVMDDARCGHYFYLL